MQRLAFFDLDDTLVDRGKAFGECIRTFCSGLGFAEDIEQWLLGAMYERAYHGDFERLRQQFSVAVPTDEWR